MSLPKNNISNSSVLGLPTNKSPLRTVRKNVSVKIIQSCPNTYTDTTAILQTKYDTQAYEDSFDFANGHQCP